MRSPEGRLAEAVGLALAIELDIKAAEVVLVKKRRPATLFGQGHVDRLAELVEEQEINVVIVDGHLSPVQQRNLEKAWNAKVIDRTGLILEIFGARARTHEGRLQVELASLTYQRSRLVRSWTHLERQRGGFGFLGGPGESQIEMDRRLIGDRITKLKRELVEVKRTRELHRGARKRVPYPVVALVGYTNAGKSTLFNRLTQSKVFAEDLLFATLDPTMRGVVLPTGKQIILSDTVGFISDLPTQLVAAFRATLEEVLEADVILHVRDRSHPDTEAQKADVELVLTELGLSEIVDRGLTEVWNKIDLMDEEGRADCARTMAEMPDRVLPASAVTGEGVDGILSALDEKLRKQRDVLALHVSPADGKRLAWLYQHGEVLEREDSDEDITLKVGLDPVNRARYEQIFSA
ncbi:GTPase HflX [Lacibacterium aquatile]|uniref:GTPase HflX n=1 Tax=Lacibacterium aquatile TaxID=1168082 RepID=A0ABW5DSV3_9PROT